MTYNPDIHHRRSVRVHEHDYSRPGSYFVTVVARNRECLFGNIVDGKMVLNELGKIVHDEWMRTEKIRQEIELDAFIVMPNHIHGIVLINDIGHNTVGAHGRAPLHDSAFEHRHNISCHRKPKSIGSFVAGFKSAVTKRMNQCHQTYRNSVWQRNYWEHIIQNESELHKIREYIFNNPLQWVLDEENPNRVTGGI